MHNKPSRKKVFLTSLFAALIINGLSAYIYFFNGAPDRLPPAVISLANGQNDINLRRSECHLSEIPKAGKIGCHILTDAPDKNNKLYFMSFGDSFSNSLMPPLEKLARKYHANGLQASFSSCPPVRGLYRYRTLDSQYRYRCKEFNDLIFKSIEQDHIKTVILFARWSSYFGHYIVNTTDGGPPGSRDESAMIFKESFLNTLAYFNHKKIEVWIITQPPEYSFNIPQLASRERMSARNPDDKGMMASALNTQNSDMFNLYEEARKRGFSNVHLIDLSKSLCPPPEKRCLLQLNDHSLYRDESHLSVFGANYIQSNLEVMFKELKKND